VYGIPRQAVYVLAVNPESLVVDALLLPASLRDETHKWNGAVMARDGVIYGVPFQSNVVLVFNPTTNITTTIAVTGPSGMSRWSGGVLTNDGLLIFVPFDMFTFGIVNPETRTFSVRAMTANGAPTNQGKWHGAVLSSVTGLMYAFPWNTDKILTYNPGSNLSLFQNVTGSANMPGQWANCVEANNKLIYCLPYNESRVLVFNPRTSAVSFLDLGSSIAPQSALWTGAVLGRDGVVYGVPANATHAAAVRRRCIQGLSG
jgi:hypothetical protein